MIDSLIDANEDGLVLTSTFKQLGIEKQRALLISWREHIDLEIAQISRSDLGYDSKTIYSIGNIKHKIDNYGRVFMFINQTWLRSSKTAAEVKRGHNPKGAL